MKQIYLLLICQGFYLGSVCQRWTFPSTMTALLGSCVEIPCTYHPARTLETSGTVWYLYNTWTYPQILNTKDSSPVIEKYKDRTSLVPGEKSCTLRIDPVRREDGGEYYPGIAKDRKKNAYKKQSIYVHLTVTEKGNIQLYVPEVMTEGEATTIRCSVDHTCGSSPPSIQWNKPGEIKKKSEEISDGSWREESELTYIPKYMDDGSSVQCTATYPNGQTTETSGRLKIKLDLLLILGLVGGLLFLLVFSLVLCIFLRRTHKKTTPTNPNHRTVPNAMTSSENYYGIIQSNSCTQPPTMRSEPSVDVKVEDNYAIYSNSVAMQPSYDIEYTVISHGQQNQSTLTSTDLVEYATVKP